MLKKLINKAVPKLYGFYFNALSLVSKKKAGDLAMQVFSFPRSGRILDFQNEFLNTARKQQLITEDGHIQMYHWKGSDKTVLLVHGWESNAWRWKFIIEHLIERDYNIIAIDAPAHGASSGTEFTAVKYSKVINKVINLYKPEIVLAHSVGAMATVYQESINQHICIEKLVLLGGPDRLDVIMRNYQKLTGFNNTVYNSLDQLIFDRYNFHISDFNTSTFIKEIKAQLLIIHSESDLIVTYDSMAPMVANSSDVTSYTSKTGGHSLHTDEVVEKILHFL